MGVPARTFDDGCKAIRSLGWFFEVSGLIHEGIDHFEPLVRTLKAKPASPPLVMITIPSSVTTRKWN